MSLSADVAAMAVQLMINLTVLGSSLAIGVWFAFSLTRAASPRVRYVVSVSAFFLAAFLPILVTFQVTPGQHRSPSIESVSPNYVSEGGVVASPNDAPSVSALTPHSAEKPTAQPARLSADIAWIVEFVTENGSGFGFLCLWISVAALLIGREITGHVLLARELRSWRPAPPTLRHQLGWPDSIPLLVHKQAGPSTVGLLRPVVVLPSDLLVILSCEAAQRVAQHELAHADWHDPLVNALLRLVRAVLWPSTPLWFLERVVRLEREAAADRAAIKNPQAAEKDLVAAEYASALVLMAKWTKGASSHRTQDPMATFFGARVGLEARVRRLLMASPRLTRVRLSLAGGAMLTGILGTALLPVASPPASVTNLVLVKAQGDFSGRVRARDSQDFQPGFAGRVEPMVDGQMRPPDEPKVTMNEQKPEPDKRGRSTDDRARVEVNQERAQSGRLRQDEQLHKNEAASTFTPDELAWMQMQNITPEYIQSIRRQGYGDVTASQLIKMKKLGITEEFIRSWQDLGYDKPPVERLVKLKKLAIGAGFAREARESGLGYLTLNQLIKMKKGSLQVPLE